MWLLDLDWLSIHFSWRLNNNSTCWFSIILLIYDSQAFTACASVCLFWPLSALYSSTPVTHAVCPPVLMLGTKQLEPFVKVPLWDNDQQYKIHQISFSGLSEVFYHPHLDFTPSLLQPSVWTSPINISQNWCILCWMHTTKSRELNESFILHSGGLVCFLWAKHEKQTYIPLF